MRAADQRLKSAGVKMGSLGVADHVMGMDDDPAGLKTAEPFDRTFIQMMIPHHEGALVMAEAELDKGGDTQLKMLARTSSGAEYVEL